MRMLAIDCATEACSLALFQDGAVLAHCNEVLGRGHAERLVPLIGSLPDKGRADEIRVSLGPGSFTGVRIGLAAARALGLAWHARVRGYSSLALLAAGFHAHSSGPVSVSMNGGHGEWFVQNFDDHALPQDEVRSLPPEEALRAARHAAVIGNRAVNMVEIAGPGRTAIAALPDARHARDLDEAVLTDLLTPIYGREPDARLPS